MALRQSSITLIALYIVMLTFAYAAVILRFVSIYLIGRKRKLHDYLCVAALISLTGYAIVTLIATVDGGLGEHIGVVPFSELTIALKFFWVFSITTFRLAILLLYIEIFTKRWFTYVSYATCGIVILFFIGSTTASLRLCKPLNYTWNKAISGKCGDIGVAELAAAAINMCLDFWIVLLPLPIVWNLQMSKHKKVAVTAAFSMGLGIAAINIARIIKVLDCPLEDFTYCTLASAVLTVAEMAGGIVVACLPTLRPVFFPRPKNITTYGSGGHTRLTEEYSKTTSLNTTSRHDFEMETPLKNGVAEAHIYAHQDERGWKDQPDAPNVIGVRQDVDVRRG